MTRRSDALLKELALACDQILCAIPLTQEQRRAGRLIHLLGRVEEHRLHEYDESVKQARARKRARKS